MWTVREAFWVFCGTGRKFFRREILSISTAHRNRVKKVSSKSRRQQKTKVKGNWLKLKSQQKKYLLRLRSQAPLPPTHNRMLRLSNHWRIVKSAGKYSFFSRAPQRRKEKQKPVDVRCCELWLHKEQERKRVATRELFLSISSIKREFSADRKAKWVRARRHNKKVLEGLLGSACTRIAIFHHRLPSRPTSSCFRAHAGVAVQKSGKLSLFYHFFRRVRVGKLFWLHPEFPLQQLK